MDKNLTAILEARAWTLGDVALEVKRTGTTGKAIQAVAAHLMVDRETAARLVKAAREAQRSGS
jgi:hypothetical protein